MPGGTGSRFSLRSCLEVGCVCACVCVLGRWVGDKTYCYEAHKRMRKAAKEPSKHTGPRRCSTSAALIRAKCKIHLVRNNIFQHLLSCRTFAICFPFVSFLSEAETSQSSIKAIFHHENNNC